ncbi:hypothetical protein [Desulfoluna sp.]|uniref:hypothetical protein n=1 Tax=Desulfoluna sp. TaxID=2045199 RepID=UPI002614110A|nr:hypothetical protein [Desulfoluna sp.]
MRIRCTLIALVVLFVCSCAHHPSLTPKTLDQAYLAAIIDAEVATPSEISKDLLAITPGNPRLIRNAQGDIRVVTWTDWKGYDTKVGQHLSLSRNVWVTVAPFMQSFCRECELTGQALDLRVRQRLGLPPHDPKTRFVEFWVSPDDLFRPSPDPEITDHEAELSFPEPQRFITISQDHRRWFETLQKESYGKGGYPWTRLGYTYDWGGKTEVGESEFIITQGADVTVHSVTLTEEYCEGREW